MRLNPVGATSRRTQRLRRVAWLLLSALPVWALAQSGGSYTMRKHVIASGVVATGGSFRLTGTIGQPVATVQTAGNFRLTSGFHGPAASVDRLLCTGFENNACP